MSLMPRGFGRLLSALPVVLLAAASTRALAEPALPEGAKPAGTAPAFPVPPHWHFADPLSGVRFELPDDIEPPVPILTAVSPERKWKQLKTGKGYLYAARNTNFEIQVALTWEPSNLEGFTKAVEEIRGAVKPAQRLADGKRTMDSGLETDFIESREEKPGGPVEACAWQWYLPAEGIRYMLLVESSNRMKSEHFKPLHQKAYERVKQRVAETLSYDEAVIADHFRSEECGFVVARLAKDWRFRPARGTDASGEMFTLWVMGPPPHAKIVLTAQPRSDTALDEAFLRGCREHAEDAFRKAGANEIATVVEDATLDGRPARLLKTRYVREGERALSCLMVTIAEKRAFWIQFMPEPGRLEAETDFMRPFVESFRFLEPRD